MNESEKVKELALDGFHVSKVSSSVSSFDWPEWPGRRVARFGTAAVGHAIGSQREIRKRMKEC